MERKITARSIWCCAASGKPGLVHPNLNLIQNRIWFTPGWVQIECGSSECLVWLKTL
jgi:hypothetical protein